MKVFVYIKRLNGKTKTAIIPRVELRGMHVTRATICGFDGDDDWKLVLGKHIVSFQKRR